MREVRREREGKKHNFAVLPPPIRVTAATAKAANNRKTENQMQRLLSCFASNTKSYAIKQLIWKQNLVAKKFGWSGTNLRVRVGQLLQKHIQQQQQFWLTQFGYKKRERKQWLLNSNNNNSSKNQPKKRKKGERERVREKKEERQQRTTN